MNNLDLWIKMYTIHSFGLTLIFAISNVNAYAVYGRRQFECGPYGFICESGNKVRICEGDNLAGPAFLCPVNTICNEDSSDVCENSINYIDSGVAKGLRCHRHERIADPNTPGCKGYILCIPNKSRFQGIKFKCTGNTIFNGYTRSCSSPDKYKCPVGNSTKTPLELLSSRRIDSQDKLNETPPHAIIEKSQSRPIDCKNYKFRVTNDNTPVRATYFCPKAPARGDMSIRCTIFSNQFCVTLEKHQEDQFILDSRAAYRRPRI